MLERRRDTPKPVNQMGLSDDGARRHKETERGGAEKIRPTPNVEGANIGQPSVAQIAAEVARKHPELAGSEEAAKRIRQKLRGGNSAIGKTITEPMGILGEVGNKEKDKDFGRFTE